MKAIPKLYILIKLSKKKSTEIIKSGFYTEKHFIQPIICIIFEFLFYQDYDDRQNTVFQINSVTSTFLLLLPLWAYWTFIVLVFLLSCL